MEHTRAFLLAAIFLASCAPPATSAPTATQTPAPTATAQPSPTPALPWIGAFYFDANASGERDPGEQPLPGFKVCIASDCGTTDASGKFEIPNSSGKATGSLKFTDPNPGTPDEMRAITRAESITVPAYNENGVTIPEQHLTDVAYYSANVPLQSGKMEEFGLVYSTASATPGICPVDRSNKATYISLGFRQRMSGKRLHEGLDINGPSGTHLFAPGKCNLTYLLVASDGGMALHMRCAGMPGELNLGHVDLSLNNYDTLHWYGIPVSEFYDEGGAAIRGAAVKLENHAVVYPGQDLHLYMGCTGTCSGTHVHIYIGGPSKYYDPAQFLDCSTP